MKRLFFVVAILAVLAVLFFRQEGGSNQDDWGEVRREDLVVGAEVSGTLDAVASVSLGPPQIPELWDYKISFLAPEGATVRQGEPVLGFDTSQLATTLLEASADRDSAQKELEKTQTDLEMRRREEELHLAEAEASQRRSALKADVPPELVAANELRQTRGDLNLAEREIAFRQDRLRLLGEEGRAELEALRAKRDRAAGRVREAQAAIASMTVAAPRDGTVVYAANRGEKKKVGDSCWRGEKVVEIPDLRSMRALGQVDEADAGRVAPGQKVRLRLDAHPDVVFTGVVSSIRGSVQKKSRSNPVKVVELGIDLDRTDPQRMSPGMRFLGTVEIERAARVLTIPAEAVLNRPDGAVVLRRRGGRGYGDTEEVRPRFGRRNATRVEVVSGLSEGDRVALRDPEAEEKVR
ncbi:MAG TPA: efflux RND transporter periplasmic adaptor subunit [Thermoanaerobaculia bacterium]|jgi:multidrug resistance efflux pump|nr:efflux RND transporter periplasmic adaptor subunit [Thermoanaerobaculia bacterium]